MLATFFVLALAQASPKLDDWVLRSERIVLARVERVVEVEQRPPLMSAQEWPHAKIRLAELRVERRFVGPGGEDTLFVAGLAFMGSRPDPLVSGERGLFFLGDGRRFSTFASDGTKRELAIAAGGALLRETLTSSEREVRGMKRLASGERVPAELLDEFTASGGASELEPFLARLEAALARTLPALEAGYATTGGVGGWGLRIGPDRRVILGQEPERVLSEEEWRGLWSLAGETRFIELPADIGAPLHTCPSFFELVLHSREGSRRVRCYDEAAEADAAYADQSARFLRLWEAVPGQKKPTLTLRSGR